MVGTGDNALMELLDFIISLLLPLQNALGDHLREEMFILTHAFRCDGVKHLLRSQVHPRMRMKTGTGLAQSKELAVHT